MHGGVWERAASDLRRRHPQLAALAVHRRTTPFEKTQMLHMVQVRLLSLCGVELPCSKRECRRGSASALVQKLVQ